MYANTVASWLRAVWQRSQANIMTVDRVWMSLSPNPVMQRSLVQTTRRPALSPKFTHTRAFNQSCGFGSDKDIAAAA